MLGNTGDELTNMWGLIATGVAVGGIGLTLSHRLWRWAFVVVGLGFIALGLFWAPIRQAAPALGGFVTAVTSVPSNWFLVGTTAIVALWLHQWRKEVVTEVRKPAVVELEGDTTISTPELRNLLETEITNLNNRTNTRLNEVLAGLAAVHEKFDQLEDKTDSTHVRSPVDDETKKLAGKVNYLTELAQRGPFDYPFHYTKTEGLYYSDLMNSMHLIWIGIGPKEARRKYDAAMGALAAAWKKGIGLARPEAEIKQLESVSVQLVMYLLG